MIIALGSPVCDCYGCSVGITESGDYAIVGAGFDDEKLKVLEQHILYHVKKHQLNRKKLQV